MSRMLTKPTRLLTFGVFTTCCLTAPCAPQLNPTDWPQFRGPTGQGSSAARGVPITWSAEKGIRWKAALPGAGASSPIVVGDRVYVTAYSGYGLPDQPRGEISQLRRHLLCLNLTNGAVLWKANVPAALPESQTVREHGYAASTPVSDGERVYVFFGKSGVFAFSKEGRQLWRASVGSQYHDWGSAASPILYKNLLIVNASVESESVVALDKSTGAVKWRAAGIRESWNTPILVPVAGKTELAVAIAGKILGFDPDSGAPLWSCDTDIAWYMVPSMVARDGVIYCIGGRSGGALAVRAGGRGDVTRTHRLWTGRKGSNVSSPVLHEGHLYWVHESLGIVYCAEAATGRLVYEERLPRADQFYASPILAEGRIYYVSRGYDTGVFVVAARPRFELIAQNKLGDRSRFDASPALAGNRILLRSDRHLYCIGGP